MQEFEQLIKNLSNSQGRGDMYDYSVEATTEALKRKLVKVFASGTPYINIKLTVEGRRAAKQLR